MRAPPTIGLFISSTQSAYEIALYSGVRDAARPVGAHVLCFTSGALRSYRGFEFQRNVLFDLVNSQNVDGLIISGTLAHPIPASETQAFFRRYENIPKISIALAMPGIPNVMVDSKQGIRDITNHLIETHHYKKFAFIRGPRGHLEAEERYEAFAETLATHGLTINPRLVLSGDYTYDSGASAMKQLLTRSTPRYQVVVAANDAMALGAMDIARAAGKHIPTEIAFTGFDDTIEGRFDPCPLTSVRQNIYDEGYLAAQLLLQQLQGQPPPARNSSAAPIVIRQSCGCRGFQPPQTSAPISQRETWPETLRANHPAIQLAASQNMAHIPTKRVEKWVASWLEALIQSIRTDSPTPFLQAIEESQRKGFPLGIELSAWQRALAAFFHQTSACLPLSLQEETTRLASQTQIHLGIIAEGLENERQLELERRDSFLRDISESLITTFDLHSLFDVLASEIPRLNVRTCYLSLFEDPQRPADLSRLIFGWRQNKRETLPPEGILFPSPRLLPDAHQHILASPGMVVEALYSKEDRLGFMLLEVEPQNASVTNALRALLSGALQGVLLLDQRRKAEASLLQSQSELQALVAKLETTNQELESFSYTISHDLRAPLRAISGYASIIAMEHGQEFDEETLRLFNLIAKNAGRMGTLIDDLLAFSRAGRQQLNLKTTSMAHIVREIIEDPASQTLHRNVGWKISALPTLQADPTLMRQVWVNLINNAVKYSSQTTHPRVKIRARQARGEIIFSIQDNGAGFDPRYAEKLFGVFQRLHHDNEFPGTGIGLAIVRRIVERHGGRTWAESELGQGATFYFSLPAPEA